MTTKLPSRRDSRRAHRPGPETPIPRPSAFRRRSGAGAIPTLAGVSRTISVNSQTLPSPARAAYQRSSSLTEEGVITGARLAHRIDITSISSSESTLSPPSAKTPHAEDDFPDTPPPRVAPSPPPPVLPPRVPLRAARRGVSQRPHLPAKQRSMSEAKNSLQAGLTDVALPRRATRSTSETVESMSSERLDVTGDCLDSTRDSNDSVFVSSSSSSDDKQVR